MLKFKLSNISFNHLAKTANPQGKINSLSKKSVLFKVPKLSSIVMNCVINKSILLQMKQGKPVEFIRNYIQSKYRVNMDISILKERVRQLNSSLELS